ncbi:MAG: hypothetical protein U1G07_08040 [Verrucomicrobiota bacterium]
MRARYLRRPRQLVAKAASLCLLVLTVGCATGSALPNATVPRITFEEPGALALGPNRFDLRTDQGLSNLVITAKACLCTAIEAGETAQRVRAEILRDRPLADLTQKELQLVLGRPSDAWSDKDQKALLLMIQTGEQALQLPRCSARTELLLRLAEVALAISNNHRSPAPSQLDFLNVPYLFCDALSNPVGKGKSPAANLAPAWNLAVDSSRLDPEASTYWQRPGAIASLDLATGFGRERMPDYTNVVWDYAGPKTRGWNPGIALTNGARRIKAKFGETHSEPFTGRIFHALGYYVEPSDHVTGLRVRYDRRLFREFNLRQEVALRLRFLFLLPVGTIRLRPYYDPFRCVAEAVCQDGTILSGQELRRRLLLHPDRQKAEDDPAEFRSAVEGEIAYLVLREANVQEADATGQSIGPWDFEGLGREHRRELRGAGLLAAWLSWFDSRFDNTRLGLIRDGSGTKLIHYFSDLGGGLGRARGTFRHTTESANDFEWRFTELRKPRGHPDKPGRFRVIGYEPQEDTGAFREMTIDDARWMARMLGQLTEEQLVQALAASGYAAAELRLYLEKLVSRRDQMIRDLEMEDEIRLLRRGGVDRHFSYDPAADRPVRWRTGGEEETLAADDAVIRNGRLMPRGGVRQP